MKKLMMVMMMVGLGLASCEKNEVGVVPTCNCGDITADAVVVYEMPDTVGTGYHQEYVLTVQVENDCSGVKQNFTVRPTGYNTSYDLINEYTDNLNGRYCSDIDW